MKKAPLYLDYAATTPVSEEVLTAILPYFQQDFGNASSRGHVYGWLAEEAIEESRKYLSTYFACHKNEVLFTSGATESINLCLKGGDYHAIAAPKTEHKATLDVLAQLKKRVQYIDVDEHGRPLTPLSNTTAKQLLSILAVNNETGVVTPLEYIQHAKEKLNFDIHLDATQAVGKINLEPYLNFVDFISLSAHKIFGPKGVGALIAKKPLNPQIVGGGQQKGLRSGTLNVPGIIGLTEAIKTFPSKPSFDAQGYFEKEIKNIYPHFIINGLACHRSPYISNIQFTGYDGEELIRRFHKIAISNGSACNSASTFPSHVMKAMGKSDEDAFACLRFSWSPFTKQEEVIFAIDHIKEVLENDR